MCQFGYRDRIIASSERNGKGHALCECEEANGESDGAGQRLTYTDAEGFEVRKKCGDLHFVVFSFVADGCTAGVRGLAPVWEGN